MRALILCLLAPCLSLPAYSLGESEVTYELSLARRQEQYVEVKMEVRGLPVEDVELAIPAWNNLYQVRDFARFVSEVKAWDGEENPLVVTREGKQTWKVKKEEADSLVVRYSVFAAQPGSFSAEVTEEHAFLHPALICLYLPDYRDIPHRLKFSDVPVDWAVATGLEFENGFYPATSYDHLIDSPFEVGTFESIHFEHHGVLYQIAVDGRAESFELAELRDMVRRIVAYQVELMGGTVPFRRYVFIFHVGDSGSGGMEHRNSTAIGLARSGAVGPRGAGVTAHEFFHLWNVKRIRPKPFEKLDLRREVYTRSLWFSEGTTSYYSLLTLVRAGLISRQEFYTGIAKQLRTLYGRPARLHQSAEESSLLAWFDKYPFYRRPENSISYYNKGALISFFLDLKIRHATGNERDLDDVIRRMDKRFGESGVGFEDEDILRAVEEVSGTDFDDFFARFVTGTVELPVEEFFELAGWNLYEEVAEELDSGFTAEWSGDDLRVTRVAEGSPAAVAGLRTGDVILASDGRPPEPDTWQEPKDLDPSRYLQVRVRRESEVRELLFFPGTSTKAILLMREVEEPSPLQEQIRQGILNGRSARVASPGN